MDDTTDSYSTDGGAWMMSRLGNAIDVLVDRQFNNPQVIQSTAGYGIDPTTGAMYKLGQTGTVQNVTPVQGGGAGMLLVIGLLFLVMNHG